jgi:hypothetical protein
MVCTPFLFRVEVNRGGLPAIIGTLFLAQGRPYLSQIESTDQRRSRAANGGYCVNRVMARQVWHVVSCKRAWWIRPG